jgi:coenzyme F420 hydrogenase subunit beta
MITDVEKVIAGGFCVGCGACAAIDSDINMRFTDEGVYTPIISRVPTPKIDEVCPFSNKGPHENELAFDSRGMADEEKLGAYLALWAGYDLNEQSRVNSSSGGGASWLLKQLFKHGHIDKVIHVKESQGQGTLFKYSISSSIEEIDQGAKTRYFPIELSEVLEFVKGNEGRYAFVGVPCFVKTVKRLAYMDKEFSDKIKFTLSIFCGHLKSAAFGESLAWQLGVIPSDIASIDFRHKIPTLPANNYGIKVTDKGSKEHVSPMFNLLGKDWGMGAFRLKACDFCDDIVGELADVSFGDAWLDKYKRDSKGTNLIIVRNELIKKIFEGGLEENLFYTEPVTSEDIVKSQSASYRHRRDGLKHRVKKLKKKSLWYPVKREFAASDTANIADELNWDFRAWYSQKTHERFLTAKRKNSLPIYLNFVKRGARIAQVLQKFIRVYKRLKTK